MVSPARVTELHAPTPLVKNMPETQGESRGQDVTEWCCPAEHRALEGLPSGVRENATRRSFARRFGLERWLASCGLAAEAVEELLEAAAEQSTAAGPAPVKPLGEHHSAASRIVGPTVEHKNGADRDSLCSSGLVAMYFSAHWCPPCHRFTPELSKFYLEAKASGTPLEVVFVPYYHPSNPAKDTKDEYDEYHAQMPWCTLPYGDNHANALKEKYGIQKIPTLVVLNENGDVVSTTGKADVEVGLDPLGSVDLCLQAWKNGTSPKLPEKPVFSFSMDDDF